jgi:hypothetical protein
MAGKWRFRHVPASQIRETNVRRQEEVGSLETREWGWRIHGRSEALLELLDPEGHARRGLLVYALNSRRLADRQIRGVLLCHCFSHPSVWSRPNGALLVGPGVSS